jgi:glucoamylase
VRDFLNKSSWLGVTAAAVLLLSGGSNADPKTPQGPPGLPVPFLGTAVVGHGGATAAIDSYGSVVDLRRAGPVGEATLAVSPERQAAGTVPPSTGLVARGLIGGRWRPFWQADSVRQRYLGGTSSLRTVARFGEERIVVVRSIGGTAAAQADRRWLARARPLGGGAPTWARAMYGRSLLVLRALTDRRSGAVAAGAREGWAYVWPRDAGAVAIAFARSGYRGEARWIVGFMQGLDLEAAARFDGTGEPVSGRAAQGDALGWVRAAERAAGLGPAGDELVVGQWRDRADYQEKEAGDHLANAIAAGVDPQRIRKAFATPRGLVRRAGDPGSALDSAAAWAVRPFPRRDLLPLVRRTLLELAANSGRYGLLPSEDWDGGEDPWTAPTAWSAWSLAALGERRAALALMAALRRAATPLGLLPERVDASTGLPVSTTPLAWSHAFAILALHELWP